MAYAPVTASGGGARTHGEELERPVLPPEGSAELDDLLGLLSRQLVLARTPRSGMPPAACSVPPPAASGAAALGVRVAHAACTPHAQPHGANDMLAPGLPEAWGLRVGLRAEGERLHGAAAADACTVQTSWWPPGLGLLSPSVSTSMPGAATSAHQIPWPGGRAPPSSVWPLPLPPPATGLQRVVGGAASLGSAFGALVETSTQPLCEDAVGMMPMLPPAVVPPLHGAVLRPVRQAAAASAADASHWAHYWSAVAALLPPAQCAASDAGAAADQTTCPPGLPGGAGNDKRSLSRRLCAGGAGGVLPCGPRGRATPLGAKDGSCSRHLWVGNVMVPDATKLTEVFRAYGPVESVRVFAGRTYAFCNMVHAGDAVAAKAQLEMQVIPELTSAAPMLVRFQSPLEHAGQARRGGGRRG